MSCQGQLYSRNALDGAKPRDAAGAGWLESDVVEKDQRKGDEESPRNASFVRFDSTTSKAGCLASSYHLAIHNRMPLSPGCSPPRPVASFISRAISLDSSIHSASE